MATILIIEDQPLGGHLLSTILRSAGYDVIEAADGEEGLGRVLEARPRLVISDILMPTVDGYEFVRRLRESPAVAATPVIFYTAMYHEREARTLANRCGVLDILTRPSPPEKILATVKAALAAQVAASAPAAHPDRDTFHRDHVRVLSWPRQSRVERLAASEQRLTAVVDLTQQIAAERDPAALLKKVCVEARQLTLAQHATTTLLADSGSIPATLFTSGLDDETTVGMRPAALDGPVINVVVTERRSVRAQNPAGRPEALGLPAEHPPVHSFLGVPLASPSRVYGWITLRNKLGAEEFSDADEQAAASLGSHAGIAYENVGLIEDLRRRLTIQEEARRRTLERAREDERSRLARLLHDRLGQAWTGLKMDLHWLNEKLAAALNRPTTDVTDKVESMMRGIEETIHVTRDIANELRPVVLDRLGLLAGIEWQGEEFERRSGIRCRVDIRVEHVELDLGRSTLVFSIVQEALTNVFRHAGATRATISVRATARRLTVSVADNGRGIPSDHLISGASLGFVGMRERAALLGGRLEVRNGRPKGTRIVLTVPLMDRRLEPRGSS